MKIRTSYIYPPIPDRRFDWSAVDDETYDGAPDAGRCRVIGYGKTEEEAVEDLMEQMDVCQHGIPWSSEECLECELEHLEQVAGRLTCES